MDEEDWADRVTDPARHDQHPATARTRAATGSRSRAPPGPRGPAAARGVRCGRRLVRRVVWAYRATREPARRGGRPRRSARRPAGPRSRRHRRRGYLGEQRGDLGQPGLRGGAVGAAGQVGADPRGPAPAEQSLGAQRQGLRVHVPSHAWLSPAPSGGETRGAAGWFRTGGRRRPDRPRAGAPAGAAAGPGPGRSGSSPCPARCPGSRRCPPPGSRACPPGPARPAGPGPACAARPARPARCPCRPGSASAEPWASTSSVCSSIPLAAGRAARRRIRSRQALTTMRCSQVVTADSPRKSAGPPERRDHRVLQRVRGLVRIAQRAQRHRPQPIPVAEEQQAERLGCRPGHAAAAARRRTGSACGTPRGSGQRRPGLAGHGQPDPRTTTL